MLIKMGLSVSKILLSCKFTWACRLNIFIIFNPVFKKNVFLFFRPVLMSITRVIMCLHPVNETLNWNLILIPNSI